MGAELKSCMWKVVQDMQCHTLRGVTAYRCNYQQLYPHECTPDGIIHVSSYVGTLHFMNQDREGILCHVFHLDDVMHGLISEDHTCQIALPIWMLRHQDIRAGLIAIGTEQKVLFQGNSHRMHHLSPHHPEYPAASHW